MKNHRFNFQSRHLRALVQPIETAKSKNLAPLFQSRHLRALVQPMETGNLKTLSINVSIPSSTGVGATGN